MHRDLLAATWQIAVQTVWVSWLFLTLLARGSQQLIRRTENTVLVSTAGIVLALHT